MQSLRPFPVTLSSERKFGKVTPCSKCRFNVGRGRDRALYLQHFLPEGNEPPPGSSNSSHRKEIEADSLEGRAKAFELKRYVSSLARLCACPLLSQTSAGELLYGDDWEECAALDALELGHGQHIGRRRPQGTFRRPCANLDNTLRTKSMFKT